MNNINNAIAQAIDAIKAAFPAATPTELNKILIDLKIFPEAPTPAVSSATIDAINSSIDKLVASERNNTNDSIGGINMVPTTETSTANLWKTMPAFAPICHAINDAKCNPITWATFLTNDFGFEHINIYNDQICELAALTNDAELLTIAPIIGTIGTLLKWGDIQELDRKIFNEIVIKYTKYTTLTAPIHKTELLTELCKLIETRTNVLDEDNEYIRWISFISPSFLKDIQTVQRLINISRIGRTNVTKATNANAPVPVNNTNKKK